MSNQPASDRALRGALSLPGLKAEASRAILGELAVSLVLNYAMAQGVIQYDGQDNIVAGDSENIG